jgi:hypothetical protein
MTGKLRSAYTICFVVFAFGVSAQSAQNQDIWIMGMGTSSCANWLSSDAARTRGNNWLSGFLSGMNISNQFSARRTNVGQNTDVMGWLGEVEKTCREEPSQQLVLIAKRTYQLLERQGR